MKHPKLLRLVVAILPIILILCWWIMHPTPIADLPSAAVSTKAAIPKAAAIPVQLHQPKAAPSIPAPPLPEKQAKESAAQKPSGVWARLFENQNPPVISAEKLRAYLQENQRSAESLLTAAHFTGDIEYLREAALRFPQNAPVQLQLALKSDDAAERRRALDSLLANDSENALGDYLSGLEYFRAGQPEQAYTNLINAAAKAHFDDFFTVTLQATEDAFLAAGYPALESKAAAFYSQGRESYKPLNELSKHLQQLMKAYHAAGDTVSAESVRQMGAALGVQAQSGSNLLIDELMGISIEKKFLDPQTASVRSAAMKERADYIRHITQSQAFTEMEGAEAVSYLDRQKLYGDEQALGWLRARHGEK